MKTKLFVAAIASITMLPAMAQKNYEMGDPNDPNCADLKNYNPLKDYIDRSKYPDFKLGIGTTVSDYLKKGTVYDLTNDNFTETVAGNAMKMGSCVGSDGSMNFSSVKEYVNTATEAGLSVYGHTLAWHAQQATGWLYGLLRDKPAEPFANPDVVVDVPLKSKDFRTDKSVGWTSDKTQYGFSLNYSDTDGLNIHTTKMNGSWEVQFVALDNTMVEKDKTYKITYEVKGSKAGALHTSLGDWSKGVGGDVNFTTSWSKVTLSYKAVVDNSFLMLQCGDFVGDIYVRNITVEEPVGAMKVSDERRYLKVEATAKQSEVYDNQFWLVCPSTFTQGQRYEFTADVRADKDAKASTQIHTNPGTYVHYEALGDIEFTRDWKTVKVSGTMSRDGKSIAFNLSEMAAANTYYFDNVSLKINGVEMLTNGSVDSNVLTSFVMKKNGGAIVAPEIEQSDYYLKLPQSTPLTAEEKREALTGAMEKWIKGMMEACDGKVKAWDVVNEAISGGGDDGEGFYTLQHYSGNDGDFFWQDYMGDLEYVRTAIRLARKYGPADVKLFINDYNLESDWDDNKKLKSLINWIKKWEADGVTKVDGIGSQMHISCYMNQNTMNSKKKHITNMLQLMVESGKLVRISELDLGMVDANGNDVPTGNMTDEMHRMMADFYGWIVQEYFRIVPVKQQWGICFWCPTDAPANSGWRADSPVGIWTLDTFYRKHAFAGITEGLGGVVYSAPEPEPNDSSTGDSEDEVPFEFASGGDVNGDGKITVEDAVCIINYVVTADTKLIDLKAADMNKDGKVTREDANLVIQKWLQMSNGGSVIDSDDVTFDSKPRMVR